MTRAHRQSGATMKKPTRSLELDIPTVFTNLLTTVCGRPLTLHTCYVLRVDRSPLSPPISSTFSAEQYSSRQGTFIRCYAWPTLLFTLAFSLLSAGFRSPLYKYIGINDFNSPDL